VTTTRATPHATVYRPGASLATLLAEAREHELRGRLTAAVAGYHAVVDAADPRFLPPGDMPARIERAVGRSLGRAELARCIVDSLAAAYAATVHRAATLAGREVDVIHVVGGGSQNALLCQLTADACGLPVVAGPTEAAALGNALVQARARGATGPGLTDLRRLLRDTQRLHRYEPRGDETAWRAAESRLPR
jgi:rhamnulokinase